MADFGRREVTEAMTSETAHPRLLQTVLDATDARRLAEFYRKLLGFVYRSGDEPPEAGTDDPRGRDWLVLLDERGGRSLAFQQVNELPASTWPDGPHHQQLHLDMGVPSAAALEFQRVRVLALGGTLRYDRSSHPDEPLYVFADPAGHPFCIFVAGD